jgi:hypothetical protein
MTTGKIYQCWYVETAALPAILLHQELLPAAITDQQVQIKDG